jgi:hypothetical protein
MFISTTGQDHAIEYFARLGPELTPERLQASFEALVCQQDELLEEGASCSPIPLAWIALAEWVGLTVELTTGRIIDGPKSEVRGLI